MIDFGGVVGLSLLGDLGYSYDSYRTSLSLSFTQPGVGGIDIKSYYSMYMHNFQVGILPKLNIGNLAIGIGAGVKIPMAGTLETKTDLNVTGTLPNQSYSDTQTTTEKYAASDFKTSVIPYVKLTFDYSFFFNDNMAFVLGAYLGYDIGLVNKPDPMFSEESRLDSFDLGINLGFKFGPRVGY